MDKLNERLARLLMLPVFPCLPREPPQSAGTLSSHLPCTERPHALQVFPCLLRPQIEVYHECQFVSHDECEMPYTWQKPQVVGIEKEELLN
jgi:hypothetical protein